MSKKWLFWVTLSALCLGGCSDDSSNSGGSVCGNGVVENGEQCDDGNTQSDDGCTSDCTAIEDGYECPSPGSACVMAGPGEKQECGNGKVESGEACDDGNRSDGDGCSATCKTEAGFECPPKGGKCTPANTPNCPEDRRDENGNCTEVEEKCGNGAIDDDEACDDGNTQSGDGCAANCSQVESGFSCDTPGQNCTPISALCGNEVIDEGEDCDAGALAASYGSGECTSACKTAHYCGDKLLDAIDLENGEECDAGDDTSTEYNGCTTECKRVNYCGDRMVQPDNEQCDDGNTDDGDGCSAKCEIEPNYVCVTSEGRSVCSSILCGNGTIDGAEACDDGNRNSGDGCSMICQIERHWRCELLDEHSKCEDTCGNGTLDSDTGEQCDDNNALDGDGCSSSCTIENGYICDGTACFARACGDGIVAGNEECDDGNAVSDDGCSKFCKRETGWHCDNDGMPCEKDVCGDGKITGDETCDEGSITEPTGGCDNCQVQMGWKCPTGGAACVEAKCGDGVVEGAETCEGENECCVQCVLQPACHCDSNQLNCTKGSCGNSIIDSGEECDDGNTNAGDGCNPICEIESIFDCNGSACKPTCGDGITVWMAGEECDDGNLVNGDGCSSQCKIESGYACTDFALTDPDTIMLPIVYRDFRGWNDGSGTGLGYMSQDFYDKLPERCKIDSGYRELYFPQVGMPIPDFQSYCEGEYCANTVEDRLDKDGKPVLRPGNEFTVRPGYSPSGKRLARTYTCPEIYAMWYRDVPEMNITIPSYLTFKKSAANPKQYEFIVQNSFFPIHDQGFHDPAMVPRAANSGKFTSEFSTYFQYLGDESLTFDGDDDAWVFINGRLAADMGCMHTTYKTTITLDEETSKQLNIYPGGIYDIKMFHAERCSGDNTEQLGSTFQFTLTGFVNSGTAECHTVCGDGMVRGGEECDPIAFADPANPTDDEIEQAKIKGCVACKQVSYCGNGVLEKGEQCDSTESWCVECMLADSTCGDNKKEGHEECDGTDGVTGDQICLENCRISGCGDGIVSGGELCDDGNLLDDDMCTSKCKLPTCGDGIVSQAIGEVCDDGVNNGSYGGCGLGCTYIPPRCGDGIVNTAEGEECDNGSDKNIGGYGGCKANCTLDIHCGDGVLQPEFEQCDEGEDNGTNACSQSCVYVIY